MSCLPSLGKYFRCQCMIARFIGIFNISLRCGKKATSETLHVIAVKF